MLRSPVSSLTATDLDSLVENQVPEGHELDFKRTLPGATLDAKKEFLGDVTSFANSRGGYLFYGVVEKQGVATEICGLPGIDPDREIARLQSMIEACVEPPLLGFTIRSIASSNGSLVLAVHVPLSWARPHVVRIEGHWRFYARDSSGKHPLNVGELRLAFLETDAAGARVRQFRAERLTQILAGDTPVPVPEGAKVVLHVVPIGGFQPGSALDLEGVANSPPIPMYAKGCSHRFNFDGLVTWAGRSGDAITDTYLQVFRNGAVEAVETYILRPKPYGESQVIPSTALEKALIEALERIFKLQVRLATQPPFHLLLSLLGVRGYRMAFRDSAWDRSENHPIEKQDLLLPELIIDSAQADAAGTIRPALDMIWSATGVPRSPNFDDQDRWIGKG